MGNETNHGAIGHHNYPERGGSNKGKTGCFILDSNGISTGQSMKGINLCLECVLPECILTLKKKRGEKPVA